MTANPRASAKSVAGASAGGLRRNSTAVFTSWWSVRERERERERERGSEGMCREYKPGEGSYYYELLLLRSRSRSSLAHYGW
jgi:hypothetical protein